MKKLLFLAIALLITVNVSRSQSQNTLTAQEKKEGWQLLFDGKTTKGWHIFNKGPITEGWVIEEESLFLSKGGAGDAITDAEYENYEFSYDWKIGPCGNSGVIYNVVEDPKYKYVWLTGPEMQVIDNTCHADAKNEKHRAGNLYDLIASPTESVKSQGEWNTAKIISNKGHLELWLNGVKQVETTMFTPEWEAMIKGSKFKDMADFGKAKKGRLALQDHGDKVWYRNLKIKVLK